MGATQDFADVGGRNFLCLCETKVVLFSRNEKYFRVSSDCVAVVELCFRKVNI